MENIDYSQIAPMTEEEKRAIYMEMEKDYLVDMLLTNQRIVVQLLNYLGDNVIYETNDKRES